MVGILKSFNIFNISDCYVHILRIKSGKETITFVVTLRKQRKFEIICFFNQRTSIHTMLIRIIPTTEVNILISKILGRIKVTLGKYNSNYATK